tara:strand:- start:32 stop:1162 length:1131 start_codon:yes stop_codon:yes gene_type:complete
MKILIHFPHINRLKTNKHGHPTAVSGEDSLGIAKDLHDKGHEVHMVTEATNGYGVCTMRPDNDTIDWDTYNLVITSFQELQLFGGYIKPHDIRVYDCFINSKVDVASWCADPTLCPPEGFPKAIQRAMESGKHYSEPNIIEFFKNDINELKQKYDKREIKYTITPIPNIDKFAKSMKNDKKRSYFSEFILDKKRQHIFVNQIYQTFGWYRPMIESDKFPSIKERKFDIFYVGSNRPARMKRIVDFGFGKGLHNSIHGGIFDSKRIAPDAIRKYADQCKATIVFSDPLHYTWGINHRFLQGLYNQQITFIDKQSNPNNHLNINDDLRKYIEVERIREVNERLTKVEEYDTIIELQNEQLKSYATVKCERNNWAHLIT